MQIQKVGFTNQDFFLLRQQTNKDHLHRLRLFCDWLIQHGGIWYQPDLETYRDYLMYDYTGRDNQPLTPSSIKAHLATIRGYYQSVLRDNRLRDVLYSQTPGDVSAADKKAWVDEIMTRVENAIAPEAAQVKVIKRQDTADEEHIRLTTEEAAVLMDAPGTQTLMGVRDTAVIALMLCTGVREAELCGLDVNDLRKRLSGETALHVRRGKGSKERLIPYGNLAWVLNIVEFWLQNAGITGGAVFRGFYKNGKSVRNTRLTTRAINQILDRYPIMVNGELRIVNPHDLRRTYARRLYEAGMDLLAIRDNLGHADSRTTLKYIGVMDVEARKPPAIFTQPRLPKL
jgi:site-specific recombinase XerD